MIAIIFIAVWTPVFFSSSITQNYVSYNNSMPLFELLKHLLGAKIWVSNIVAAAICATLAFLITNLNTTHFFINERTFVPALIFIFITALLPQYQILNPALPASLFIIFALKRMLESYNKQGVAYNFFDVGILIGTGSLFYANLIWFGTLIFIGIAIFRSVNVKEISVSILGLIIPYIIMFGLYYMLNYDLNNLLSLIFNNLFSDAASFGFSTFEIAMLIFMSIVIIFSLAQILMFQGTTKIKSRKTFLLLIWTFFIALSVYFFVPSASCEIIWILAIPSSYFIANYFIFSKRKILSEVLFCLFFLTVVLMQVLYFI
jgi:hypothetical protein